MATEPMAQRAIVAHCDWSKDPRKRWLASAIRKEDAWEIALPEPVGDTSDLLARLSRRAEGGVVLGFDFPIGLPVAYGSKTGFPDFRAALGQFGHGDWQAWYDVCDDAAQISSFRPFYPSRPGGRARTHLFDRLGLAGEDLLRLCDRATSKRQAACMLFWTLGGNQVGKGAITGWREVLVPNLDRIGIWPFDGTLATLDNSPNAIVVETYPGEVYGHLGIPRRPAWSKRRQEGRRRVGAYLHSWMASRSPKAASSVVRLIEEGFGPSAAGEDQFDAMVGLFGMLDVVDGRRPDGAPHNSVVELWEGWILGQGS